MKMNETGDARLMTLFMRAGHLLHHKRHREGQERILGIIYRHGSMMTQRELLEFRGIRSASLSELLGKIEAKGYIRREKSEEDKRTVNVYLTAKGAELAKELEEERVTASRELFAPLSQTDKDLLEGMLERLIGLWEDDSKHR